MSKRNKGTLGDNDPFGSVVPDADDDHKPPSRERFTVQLPPATINRLRNAAYWERQTLTGITTRALEHELDAMEEAHGDPYAQRPRELGAGRPPK